MTRHARNCTAGAVYTYHEKQKDTRSCGYGTQKSRVGKDSVKDFDACSLTLQPCRNPVVTPDGYLYDKEAILEYFIHQKTEIARQLKEFDKQKKRDENELKELAEAEQQSKAASFKASERSIVKEGINNGASGSGSSISNMANGRDKTLPSFWIANLTPASKKVKLVKPSNVVVCPMSGKPLKIKDLIEVKFTQVNDPDDKRSLITKKNRYMCAVTHDILNNSVPCAVLKTSNNVVTMECVEKLIKLEMKDPLNGKTLTDKDIIPLQRGGTGYASTNETLDAKVKRPVLQA